MYRSILVPVDIAEIELARPALAAAARLAETSGGTLRLLHVRSALPVTYMEFVPADFEATGVAEAEASLREIEAEIALPRDRVSTCVRVGSIYGEVLDEARACDADLIVIGSHRPTMATYLLGSNAGTIVRHAECSVLVVR